MGQSMQPNWELAVALPLMVPGRHCVQNVAPGSAEYPRGQHTVAPGGLNVPLAQGMHCSEAGPSLYVFAGQGSQEMGCPAPPAVYTVPGSQGKQLAMPATLPKPGVSPAMYPAAQHTPHPAALTAPPVQGAQAAGEVPPEPPAARPEGHKEHAGSPVPPIEYVPGVHGAQAVAPSTAE